MGIIKRQAIAGSLVSYIGVAIGFVTQSLLVPHLLTKDQVGLLGLLSSLALVLAQFANLGINGAGGRYFPYFRDTKRQHNGYLLLACSLSAIGLILAANLLFWLRPWVVEQNSAKSALFVDYYYWLLPLTFFIVYFYIFDIYAKLLYATVLGTFLLNVVQRLGVLAAVIVYGLKLVDFQTFMVVWLLSYALPMVLMMFEVWRKHGLWLRPRFLSVTKELRRNLARYALLTLATGLSSQIIWTIDRVMLNNDRGLEDTGVYNIASYFASVIMLPATALYKVAGTVIADSWKTNDLQNIETIYRKSCLNQLIIGGLVFVGIAANIPNVFQFLPKGYESGTTVILWLGLGKLIDMSTGTNGLILTTSRYYAYDSVFFVVLIFITIGLNKYLIPLYGMEGAAIGAAISTLLYNGARTLFVWYKFNLQPFTWHNIAILALIGGVWWLATLAPYHTGLWPAGIDIAIRSTAITVVFLGVIYGLRLSPDMNDLFDGARRRVRTFF
ncbi:hypothetical protein GCM10028805_59280 [Spirosoma harenae]